MSHLFIGSAVSTIGARGDLALHDPFCVTIQSRAAKDQLFVGLGPDARCMVVYDRIGSAERQERCDEQESGDDRSPAANDETRRRLFGFAAPTRMDGKGRITIARWMRDRGAVRRRALLIGMGHYFEVWDLDRVIDDGPPDVKALAALHLASTPDAKEDLDDPAL